MIEAPALVLVGASGVGKNTVAEALLRAEDTPFRYIRSLCTRKKRETFTDEYIYVSETEFLRRVEAKEMLEYTRYGGNYYGTPLSEILSCRKEGRVPLMILDINGVENIRRIYPDFPIYAVYLYAEPAEIRKRLWQRDLSRETEQSRERVLRRLQVNKTDFLSLLDGKAALFDAFVENRVVSEAVEKILLLYSKKTNASEEERCLMQAFFLRCASYEI